MSAEQVWLDFLGIDDFKNRPVPFIDAVPVHMWIATPVPSYDNSSTKNQSNVRRTHSASPLNSPVYNRKPSEAISPKRKSSEPLLSTNSLGNASGPSLVVPTANGLHNSVPSLSSCPEASIGFLSHNLRTRDGPPPAYETGNGSQRLVQGGGELPPPYETLAHNGTILPGALEDEAPPLPEKVPLSDDLRSELTKMESHSQEEMGTAPKADLSLLVYIPQCVNLQLDHFQFVFLLRLQEMLVKLQEDLGSNKATDANDLSSSDDSVDFQPTVLFSILAREAGINIVLPPAPDRDASRLDRDPSQNTSRNVSSLSSYLDPGIVSDSGCHSPEVNGLKSHSRSDSDGGPSGRDVSLSSSEERSKVGQEQLSSSRPSSSQSACHTSGRVSSSSGPDSEGWLMVAGSDNQSASGLSKNRTESDSSNFSSQVESSTSRDSNSRETGKESKEPKLVSILCIGGEDVEVAVQFNGSDKVIKLICPELRLEELGVMSFDKYLNQKSCKKPVAKTIYSPVSEVTPMVRLRAEFGPSAERFEPTAGERGFAHVKVNGMSGTLLLSTLGNLADCLEDEVLLPPMPVLVEVNNSSVSVNNDLPPALISAPIAIPLDLSIENIAIRRSHTGVLHIQPMSSDSQSCDSESASIPITRQESIHTSQLSLSDSASVCSRAESLENEKQCLVAQMSVSRVTLQALQEERDALLKTIERLQQELSFTNREQDLLQEKMTSFQQGGRKRYR